MCTLGYSDCIPGDVDVVGVAIQNFYISRIGPKSQLFYAISEERLGMANADSLPMMRWRDVGVILPLDEPGKERR